VRPQLEYALNVWGPGPQIALATANNINQIEAVPIETCSTICETVMNDWSKPHTVTLDVRLAPIKSNSGDATTGLEARTESSQSCDDV